MLASQEQHDAGDGRTRGHSDTVGFLGAGVSQVILFLVLAIVLVAFLLVPEVFVALWGNLLNNPELGVLFLPVLVLILVWIYRRLRTVPRGYDCPRIAYVSPVPAAGNCTAVVVGNTSDCHFFADNERTEGDSREQPLLEFGVGLGWQR